MSVSDSCQCVCADTPRRCVWSANDEKPRGTVATSRQFLTIKARLSSYFLLTNYAWQLYGNFLTENDLPCHVLHNRLHPAAWNQLNMSAAYPVFLCACSCYCLLDIVCAMMLMQSRGCPLKGLPSTPTLEAHRQRFVTNNWEKAEATDLDTIYKYHLDAQDKRRCAWPSLCKSGVLFIVYLKIKC